MKVRYRQSRGELRRTSYPDHGEQIGALMKAVNALLTGAPVPPDALAVIERVEAVKTRYPKRGED